MRLSRWAGKVALITGASSGIGLATARRLGEAGMKLALAARRADPLDSLKNELAAAGTETIVVPTDLRRDESILAMFDAVREVWGGVDVLINNAGLGRNDTIAEGKTEDWREVLDVNVLALTVCIREALVDMAGKADAQIVNISPIAAHRIPPGRNATFYGASKHAVRGITDGLRDELVQKGSPVKIGMISPGLVETGFHEAFYRDGQKGREAYTNFKALEPVDIADAVIYMLSTPPHVQINDIILRPLAQPH